MNIFAIGYFTSGNAYRRPVLPPIIIWYCVHVNRRKRQLGVYNIIIIMTLCTKRFIGRHLVAVYYYNKNSAAALYLPAYNIFTHYIAQSISIRLTDSGTIYNAQIEKGQISCSYMVINPTLIIYEADYLCLLLHQQLLLIVHLQCNKRSGECKPAGHQGKAIF